MTSDATAISIQGLSISYDRERALANVYLEIPKGKIIGVIGPNGAGKSTLFKAILSLIPVDHGTIKIFQQKINNEVRRRIAYVPQKTEMDLDFPASVEDLVLIGRYPHKKIFEKLNSHDLQIAQSAIVQLGLEELYNEQIGELSGGQLQRALIARALCQEAELYLLDEPFVGVDVPTEKKIIKTIRQEAEEGKTILVVHHDLSTVKSYFDEVILLNQHLIAAGPVDDVYDTENLAKCYGPQLPILHKAKKGSPPGQKNF